MTSEILSPCNRKCLLERGVCVSCFREAEEIYSWWKLSYKDREAIMVQLEARRAKYLEEKKLPSS